MDTEEEVNLLTELRNCPLSLRVALYDIAMATELQDRGQYADNMDNLQTCLRKALEYSNLLGNISLKTYDYISRCFLE